MAGWLFVCCTVDLLWTHTKYLKITCDECAISLICDWCTQSCGLDCNLKWGLNSTPNNKKSIYHTVWRGDLLSTVAKASQSSATSLIQIESPSHSQTHTLKMNAKYVCVLVSGCIFKLYFHAMYAV